MGEESLREFRLFRFTGKKEEEGEEEFNAESAENAEKRGKGKRRKPPILLLLMSLPLRPLPSLR
jgi:hypothetical protein